MCPYTYVRNGEFSSTIQDWTRVQVQGISDREGRPKRRRFVRPAHGLRSSGGPRLWTACSGPTTTSRPTAALRVPHHIRMIVDGFSVPSTRNVMAPCPSNRPSFNTQPPSPKNVIALPPSHHPTQYPGATLLRSVRTQGTARYPRESRRSLASDPTCLAPAWRSLGRRMLRGSEGGERGRRRQARDARNDPLHLSGQPRERVSPVCFAPRRSSRVMGKT